MIKIIVYIGKAAMYLPFVYLMAEVEALPSTAVSVERWAAFFLWVLLMISIGVAAKKAFESVWLKKGFEGVDSILDSQEALQFLAAVMSYIFIEVFIGLHATEFSGLYKHESFKYYLTFSGCVGTGGFALFDRLLKNKLSNHIIETFSKNKDGGH